MKKEYLLNEIVESLQEINLIAETLEENFLNKRKNDFLNNLEEIDMIAEHIISCTGALRGKSV